MNDKNKKENHQHNIDVLLNMINIKVSEITKDDYSLILQVFQAITDVNQQDIGLQLLNVLETMNFDSK